MHILDLAAKLDATADFVCRGKWGGVEYPPPFGRDAYPEEAYIAEIDAKTGASLKLTILNAKWVSFFEYICIVNYFSIFTVRAVDPHSFFADPVPAVLFNANPDPAA